MKKLQCGDGQHVNLAEITLYHINGKEVRLADFTVGFFMELAKEKKGINFKTLLVA